jgi:hypothetical protein
MEESKIVIALKKFKRDYDWDKSLSPSSSTALITMTPPLSDSHKNTAIEDFLNANKRTRE